MRGSEFTPYTPADSSIQRRRAIEEGTGVELADEAIDHEPNTLMMKILGPVKKFVNKPWKVSCGFWIARVFAYLPLDVHCWSVVWYARVAICCDVGHLRLGRSGL